MGDTPDRRKVRLGVPSPSSVYLAQTVFRAAMVAGGTHFLWVTPAKCLDKMGEEGEWFLQGAPVGPIVAKDIRSLGVGRGETNLPASYTTHKIFMRAGFP